MKLSNQIFGIGVAIAIAAVLGGATAAALSTWRAPSAMNRSQATPADREGDIVYSDEGHLLSFIDQNTMPIVNDALAIRDRGIGPAAIGDRGTSPTAAAPSALLTSSEATPNATCQEHWRPLASGPVGREVANLCPGERLLPLPPLRQLRAPELTLPGLGTLNRMSDGGQLAMVAPMKEGSALRADHRVLHAFHQDEQRFVGLPPSTSASAIASVPYIDTLGWSPTEHSMTGMQMRMARRSTPTHHSHSTSGRSS